MSSASISFAGSLRVWRPVGQCGPRRSCSQSPGASSPRSRHQPHPAQEGTSRGEEARRPRVLAHPGGAYGDGIAQAAPGAQATLYMSPVSEPENLHKQRGSHLARRRSSVSREASSRSEILRTSRTTVCVGLRRQPQEHIGRAHETRRGLSHPPRDESALVSSRG